MAVITASLSSPARLFHFWQPLFCELWLESFVRTYNGGETLQFELPSTSYVVAVFLEPVFRALVWISPPFVVGRTVHWPLQGMRRAVAVVPHGGGHRVWARLEENCFG